MNETPTTTVSTHKQGSTKQKRTPRKTIILILQLIPLVMGMIGLYLVSSWSLEIRNNYEIETSEHAYYFGLILILLALQGPVLLEIYRRRAKHFLMRRVVLAFICVTSLLVLAAYNVAPDLELEELELIDD